MRRLNLDLFRSFVAIAESGSLSKSAERMRVSQSTLTRQMQALEQEIGGKLLERTHRGVALTAAGQMLFTSTKPLIAKFDAAIADTRKRAQGRSGLLRIGYLISAATEYLNPALAVLRREHPELKIKLMDLSPGQQIAALSRGDIDLGLLGNADASLARECFVKRLVSLPVVVGMPEKHPLAAEAVIDLRDLRREMFIGAKDDDLPGYNHWIAQLCRRTGFRPRFVEDADSLSHTLSLLVAENAVTLLPALVAKMVAPGVTFRPLRDRGAKWDLLVAWQRGKISEPVRALVGALAKNAPGVIGRGGIP
jgi:DNA-binding transcriptional LysR family regulator